jgi:spermidine/putrescine transport system ATP-binding protein
MSDTSPLLELTGIHKSFQSQRVVEDFSLSIGHGEFFTLLGPSGCGKTTILRLIAGFETPDSGKVMLEGRDITQASPVNRPVNTVFQSYALFPHMSVFENVAFGLRMSGVSALQIKQRVEDALEMVRLPQLAQKKPHQLSGGQQQRVSIARAIVNRPKLLLLDESLSALDRKLRHDMQMELKQLQRQLGITFVFVTHDQEEALSMSDRVLVMRSGRAIQLGTPRDIYENPRSLFVARFIGEINEFEATIIRKTGENKYCVRIADREMSVNSLYAHEEGATVHVLLRPEDLRVTQCENGSVVEGFQGRVIERNYRGKTLDSVIALDNGKTVLAGEFFDEDDPSFDYRIDQRVCVKWVDGWEVVLPYER